MTEQKVVDDYEDEDISESNSNIILWEVDETVDEL